jgi:outer membrane protein assembly factor BamB
MFGHDQANTGYSSDIDGPYTEIAHQWTFETGAAVTASPTIAGNTLYVSSTDSVVYAVDPYVGREL